MGLCFKQIAGLKMITCLWTRLWMIKLTAAAQGAEAARILQPAGNTKVCRCPGCNPSHQGRSSTAARVCKFLSFPARMTTFWKSTSRDNSVLKQGKQTPLETGYESTLKDYDLIRLCCTILTLRRPMALDTYWPWKHQTIVSI